MLVTDRLTIDWDFSNIFPTGKCLLQKIKCSYEASFIFDLGGGKSENLFQLDIKIFLPQNLFNAANR